MEPSIPLLLDKSNIFRYIALVNTESFIDASASGGWFHFTTEAAAKATGTNLVAARAAIRRMKKKGYVAVPFRGFHLIVPPEYRAIGCLPADQFVPLLMNHLDIPYYAGLLSAAEIHGAAHQKAQEFQVIVPANRPEIRCGSVRVHYIARRNAAKISCIGVNTARGILKVSSPEATAFDLAGYPEHCGGLSNVATVLREIAHLLDQKKLVHESQFSPAPWHQRLGFLLDLVGAKNCTEALAAFIAVDSRDYVPLRTGMPVHDVQRDLRWKVLVNERVEPDL
jgi:predicted transcriptional regulator of viral defense system